MVAMKKVMRIGSALMLAAALSLSSAPASHAAGGTGIAVVVNGSPITTGDVAKRVAFMRLQKATGGEAAARQQLVDEVLKRQEVLRVGMSVSTDDVDAAVKRFAAGNKLTLPQLTMILDKAGVGLDHFKQYVAISMSWPRVVNARFGGGKRLSNEELVKRMQENGGKKPVTTEYFLQQIIFVIPEAKRNAILGKRQAEANASRSKFPGCEQSKVFAATMLDVSVRNLGRMVSQELPPEWKPLIEKTEEGRVTESRVTDKGVEYLAVCRKREVSDDMAAEIVFRAEDLESKKKGDEDPNAVRYIEELRKKAQIVNK
ncbi:molecular chaperone SurA [Xaviernesmea oryzae]|uniref:Molecular chaperone SurA n=1 Tax=Xaviernesmea oryzae TaxID=464029 RepID=A0A1Q9AT40_9HYPH|nr:peptidylprolyl isomerase [Xaviernesmea oryzae]OLP58539.1 molecular chaperone SurA [Xaviernesmea oryzae]SEK61173.1 periplasmic chaperone for outer membrane proteins SurA [Xaviernesmea oryzae]